MTAIKVMLADHSLDGSHNLDKVTFPKLVMPKYDGIRIYTHNKKLYNRSGKLVPNIWLQYELRHLPSGLEGEIVVNDNFVDTTSCLRSHEKRDFDWKLYLFDTFTRPNISFHDRYLDIIYWLSSFDGNVNRIFEVPTEWCNNLEELLQLEAKWSELYEGVIIRDPYAKYKFGRATFNEQSFLTLKRYATEQARVIGYKCKLEDDRPVDTLGALTLDFNGVEFSCGSGLNDELRDYWWKHQDELVGKMVEFKYQPSGQVAPRFPVFLRFL